MKKDTKKPVVNIRKKLGTVEALIHSIIPTLILMCLLLGFWNLVVTCPDIASHTEYAPNMLVVFTDSVVCNPIILLSVPGLLGLNFLAFYIVFRIVRKCVAYPWCCVAVFSQLIVVCFCVIGEVFIGDVIRSIL